MNRIRKYLTGVSGHRLIGFELQCLIGASGRYRQGLDGYECIRCICDGRKKSWLHWRCFGGFIFFFFLLIFFNDQIVYVCSIQVLINERLGSLPYSFN